MYDRLTALLFAAAVAASASLSVTLVVPRPASASTISPFQASWCTGQGAQLTGWTGTSPNLPICGPGPAYGGDEQYIDIPDPYGGSLDYYNATPGFQCVELAERYLAVVAGLAAVEANGSTVVANYHAAYPSTTVVVNGAPSAVGHAPSAGDVISFSTSSNFFAGGDGHVAVVTASHVDASGNGQVQIVQENVASNGYARTLDIQGWRLVDPEYAGNAEYQFPYAEWLIVPSSHPASSATTTSGGPTLVTPAAADPLMPLFAEAAHLRRSTPLTAAPKAPAAKKTALLKRQKRR